MIKPMKPKSGLRLWWWRNGEDYLKVISGLLALPVIGLLLAGFWQVLLIGAAIAVAAMILLAVLA